MPGPVALTLTFPQTRVELMSTNLIGKTPCSLTVNVAPLEVAGFTKKTVPGRSVPSTLSTP